MARIDAVHIDTQALLDVLVHAAELLDGIVEFDFEIGQGEVFAQAAVGVMMNAGEDGAAKIVGDAVRLAMSERGFDAAAAGPGLRLGDGVGLHGDGW